MKINILNDFIQFKKYKKQFLYIIMKKNTHFENNYLMLFKKLLYF